MHPSELVDQGDRALFTFTERPPNSTKQFRWYFGISYHRSDGHTPALHYPFDDDHEWIIYEYIPITDHASPSQSQSQPAPPPTSFAVYRPTNDYHLQHRPLSTLNVLLPWSSNPPPLGVTTQIIRDQWEASFHLLTRLKLPTHHEEGDTWPAWEWVRDDIINDFLTGRSLEAEDGLVQDGQDFVSIVLADILTDEGIVSEEEYREWWDSVHPHWKGYMEVEGFKVSAGLREREGHGGGRRRPEPEEMVSPLPIILPIPTEDVEVEGKGQEEGEVEEVRAVMEVANTTYEAKKGKGVDQV